MSELGGFHCSTDIYSVYVSLLTQGDVGDLGEKGENGTKGEKGIVGEKV